ncbi:MAG TPA: Gfo/Idh/MocA family oxidoreductase [Solirubrobacteraceae bacterium]|jgi:predicted dehydrogenase|nr:Gfo/Idh/MocA family oxidoreductase [Solirubrobacteraceae bacterium]
MTRLRVAIVGCGLVGGKRAHALGRDDELIACHDIEASAARSLAARHGCAPCATLRQLLDLRPDVVIVASVHAALASLAELALAAGAHVLVEKPGGVSSVEIDRLIEHQRTSGRLVKVGFNHRFHPALARVAEEARSGRHGEPMRLRARYGHGGRPGYEREWRADPARSGGGELVDQGMHLLDLSHWLLGPLPLHSALLRTQFWDAPVEDNAALILGAADARHGPWALLAVSWTEWKNLFSLELYCQRAKLQVDGLTGSYGQQRLQIHRMGPELGPPDLEEIAYPGEDRSWSAEWEHFAAAVRADDGRSLLGDLEAARYAWTQIESAYALAAAGAEPSPAVHSGSGVEG